MINRIFILKVALQGMEDTLWRRIAVPRCITLDRLHDVLQIAMGWKDCHLHSFTIGRRRFTETRGGTIDSQEVDESQCYLEDLIARKGRSFSYEYDFGDCWEHEIMIESGTANPHDPRYPAAYVCLDGQGACPPEDVGGISGYQNFISAMEDPSHPEHEDYKAWYAGFACYNKDFDKDFFSLDLVNLELKNYYRWSRPRGLWPNPQAYK